MVIVRCVVVAVGRLEVKVGFVRSHGMIYGGHGVMRDDHDRMRDGHGWMHSGHDRLRMVVKVG